MPCAKFTEAFSLRLKEEFILLSYQFFKKRWSMESSVNGLEAEVEAVDDRPATTLPPLPQMGRNKVAWHGMSANAGPMCSIGTSKSPKFDRKLEK